MTNDNELAISFRASTKKIQTNSYGTYMLMNWRAVLTWASFGQKTLHPSWLIQRLKFYRKLYKNVIDGA